MCNLSWTPQFYLVKCLHDADHNNVKVIIGYELMWVFTSSFTSSCSIQSLGGGHL